MKIWIEPEDIILPEDYKQSIGGHPLVAQALFRRGIVIGSSACGFLNPDLYKTCQPDDLPGMDTAVSRLEYAIDTKETILVWGDFDVDGQTATTLLVSALKQLGGRVHYHIPLRASESHGISLEVLKKIICGDYPPSVLLTCDTGITANLAVELARSNGVDVVITDHHELPSVLPPALAIINPKLLPAGHALSHLPGVGVAYKLAEALFQRLNRGGECEQYFDLAALGIVADLAVLQGDTRYLLQRGLASLRNVQRVGILALLERAELNPAWLTEEHIAFEIAPRLNALGRLGDANLAVELLSTEEASQARLLALQLEGMNNERKLITEQVFRAALAQLEEQPELLRDPVIVLSHHSWPAGVIGIVAARLVERLNKPVVLISTPIGEVARGSARSIEGINITNAFNRQAEILLGFGGHAMAAGLSIEPNRIPEFRRSLGRTVASMGAVAEAKLVVDGYINFNELTIDLTVDLERLAPFGIGNPPLVLVNRRMRLVNQAPVGQEKEHMLATVQDELGTTHRLIWWHGATFLQPESVFDLAFTARSSNFRGQKTIQFEWVDWRPVEETIDLKLVRKPHEVLDYRNEQHPEFLLLRLLAESEMQVWAEGDALKKLKKQKIAARNRLELIPAEPLVIWTAPASPEVLFDIMGKIRPTRIILFAVNPETDSPEYFFQRLTGLVKYSLSKREGLVQLENIAAAMAQRQLTVRWGIYWLAAGGHIEVCEEQGNNLWLAQDGKVESQALQKTSDMVRSLLEETHAYREYYSRMDKDLLVY